MKKKLVTLLLMLCFGLVACNSQSNEATERAQNQASQQDESKKEENDSSDSESEATESENTDNEGSGEDKIYFAGYFPLTGSSQGYGASMRAAAELAIKDINEAGGVLGKEVVLDVFDDQNDANEAVNIANKIIADGKYVGVVGAFSTNCTMSSAPVYEQAKMVNYTPSSSHSELSSIGDYVFQNYLTQAYESEKYADYLYNEMGIESVGIIYVNNDYGNNVVEHFTKNYEELGGTITTSESYIPEQTTDFTPMITKIKESDPEAFYPVSFYEDTTNILKQAEGLDFKADHLILTSSNMVQALIDLAGELVEDAVIISAFPAEAPNEKFARVFEEYEEETGKPGDLYVMLTYDVTDQLATAINEAGTIDSETVRDTLNNMKGYEALAGPYDMSEDGRALRQVFPVTVKDGKFVNVE